MIIPTPADAVRHGIAYVPEDRRRHGVILDMPVAANTTLATLRATDQGTVHVTGQGIVRRAEPFE